MTTLVIAGCGLLGTSVARAYLRAHPDARLLGIEPDSETRAAATALKLFTQLAASAADAEAQVSPDRGRGTSVESAGVSGTKLSGTGVIGIAASPPAQLAQTMRELSDFCDLVIDVGSIKAPVIEELAAHGPVPENIVPCHPMAGSHLRGPDAGTSELFDGRWVFVVPGSFSAAHKVTAAHEFWTALGAQTQEIDAESHDREVAFTSHLPHLLASAYMGVQTPQTAAAGTGFMEFTRLAKANPEMWSQVLVTNREVWRPLLRDYLAVLQQIDELMAAGDTAAVQEWLADRRLDRLAVERGSDQG